MLRAQLSALALAAWTSIPAQEATQAEGPLTSCMEAIGVSLNKAQVVEKALASWEYSFGQEPGARILSVDRDNGTIEGEARVKFRSSLLMAREESTGSVSYKVTISARNGQCTVRVHDLWHSGNRSAARGPLDAGQVHDGIWPMEHYPGLGLSASRRLHDDIRAQATTHIAAVMRSYSARLRLLAGP